MTIHFTGFDSVISFGQISNDQKWLGTEAQHDMKKIGNGVWTLWKDSIEACAIMRKRAICNNTTLGTLGVL